MRLACIRTMTMSRRLLGLVWQNICQKICQSIGLEMPWWGSLEVKYSNLSFSLCLSLSLCFFPFSLSFSFSFYCFSCLSLSLLLVFFFLSPFLSLSLSLVFSGKKTNMTGVEMKETEVMTLMLQVQTSHYQTMIVHGRTQSSSSVHLNSKYDMTLHIVGSLSC